MQIWHKTSVFGILALVCGLSLPAVAQAPQCGAWQAELASLSRSGGDPGAARAAQRVGAELSQLSAQSRSLGCDRQGFLFFGSGAPPQCGLIRQRIGELQASYGALQQRAQGGGDSARRAQLQAAINSYCRPGVYQTPEPPRQRGLFEALFGTPERGAPPPSTMPEIDQPLEPREPAQARWGSGKAVCVRSCDGFFFPLPTSAGGRDGAEDMCQALCPASETKLFYMGGSGDIENAMGPDGPYSSMPNAGRYLKSFDPACGCRKAGESWAKTLADAEEMLERRKGDVIVTAQKAEELSRPREARKPEAKPKPALVPAAAPAGDETVDPALISTSGKESAGIGPQSIGNSRIVGIDQGQRRKMTDENGETRTVRIVAPALSPDNDSKFLSGEGIRR